MQSSYTVSTSNVPRGAHPFVHERLGALLKDDASLIVSVSAPKPRQDLDDERMPPPPSIPGDDAWRDDIDSLASDLGGRVVSRHNGHGRQALIQRGAPLARGTLRPAFNSREIA